MATDPATLESRKRRIVTRPNDRIDGMGTLHQIMASKWDVLEDLLDGTDAMRARGERWLPKHEKEQRRNWQRRRDRSFLFAAFKEVVASLTAKPFSTAVTLKNTEALPESVSMLEDNPSRTGQNLTDWSREVFRTAITYGLTHVLVDFPINAIAIGENRTPDLDEEDALDLRPRLVHIKPRNLIGWDTVFDPFTGEERLVRIRILERRVEPLGRFGDQTVDYITIWTAHDFHRHRRAEGDEEFVPMTAAPIPHNFGAIPILTFYTNRDGMMTAQPPLWDLADTNLQHWQVSSDFSNIMHVMRFAILFAKGIPEEKWDDITIGPNNILKTDLKDVVLEWVEHGGNATGAGMADIEKLEERMERQGLNPLIRRSGTQTATAAVINNARTSSQMQAWVEGFESFLTLLYHAAARWTEEEIPEDFEIEVFKDFDIVLRGGEDLRELREARKIKEITSRMYLEEIQRRGLISEGHDIDDVLEELAEEKAANILTMMSQMEPGDGGGGDDETPPDRDGLEGEGSGAGAAAA
jgi:hypothetical protein